MAEFKEKVSFDVDSKQLKEAFELFKKIQNQFKVSNEYTKKGFDIQQQTLKVLNQIVNTQKAKTKEEEKQLSLQEKLNRLYKEAGFSRTLKDLEKPQMGALEYSQKYKGASGGFTRMSEYVTEVGERRAEEMALDIQGKELEYKDIVKEKGAGSEEAKEKKAEIEEAKLNRSKQIGQYKSQANQYAALAKAAQKVEKAMTELALKPFKELYNGVKKVVQSMIDLNTGVATFATNTSLITNTAAREQQIKYGLTSSQNYAFTKAKEMLNIQSDEDLMYMNQSQRDKFLSYMERYSQWYDEMESSGVLAEIQDMQLQFKELKEELAMEFLQWVAENKETIMTCIKGIFEFIKIVAKVIINIVNFLTGSWGSTDYGFSEVDTASDTVNNNNSRNTNIVINANTTNNATGVLGSQEALDNFNKENWSNLAKQVVEVIGG